MIICCAYFSKPNYITLSLLDIKVMCASQLLPLSSHLLLQVVSPLLSSPPAWLRTSCQLWLALFGSHQYTSTLFCIGHICVQFCSNSMIFDIFQQPKQRAFQNIHDFFCSLFKRLNSIQLCWNLTELGNLKTFDTCNG